MVIWDQQGQVNLPVEKGWPDVRVTSKTWMHLSHFPSRRGRDIHVERVVFRKGPCQRGMAAGDVCGGPCAPGWFEQGGLP